MRRWSNSISSDAGSGIFTEKFWILYWKKKVKMSMFWRSISSRYFLNIDKISDTWLVIYCRYVRGSLYDPSVYLWIHCGSFSKRLSDNHISEFSHSRLSENDWCAFQIVNSRSKVRLHDWGKLHSRCHKAICRFAVWLFGQSRLAQGINNAINICLIFIVR